MARLKLGVLISGRGSNLQSLIDACADPAFPAEIVLVISNIPNVQGLDRAEKANIPTKTINHKDYDAREKFDQALTETLQQAGVELVCLAGFMRIVTAQFLAHWPDQVINIHPSLLPAFKGIHVHERVIEAGVKFSGCTVHYVVPEMDAGPIITQACVPVKDEDTPDTLAARVLEQEHVIYPLAVRLIAEKRLQQ
ncbi:MAG: phosphoribosylglycinamide formyltransferase [Rhodospirillaceae bacterium]|jgi:phosphoribosylglycinamide formyltransferase-1